MKELLMHQGNVIPVLRGTGGAGKLDVAAASAASAAFEEQTLVVFMPDVDMDIKIGRGTPVATTDGTSDRVFGGMPSLPYLVQAGEAVAGIVAEGSGALRWVKVG